MAILQKFLGTFSLKNSTVSLTLIFMEFIFNFDVCCVSRKFTPYACLHLSKKWLLCATPAPSPESASDMHKWTNKDRKGNRPSLKDNVFINIADENIYIGNILDKITDHLPNFVIIENLTNKLLLLTLVKTKYLADLTEID